MTEAPSHSQYFDRVANDSKQVSFSSKLWGIDWEDYFPLALSRENEKVAITDFDHVNRFYKEHAKIIFSSNGTMGNFLATEEASSIVPKLLYYQVMGDFFAFFHSEKMIGVFVGTPVDWSGYYIRSISLLPEFQNGKRYQSFLSHLLQVLSLKGIQRVELDTSPSNLGMNHVHNKFQFNVTGVSLSERWGSLLHFTKFLSSKHEMTFLNQFCYGAHPQLDRRKF